MKATRIWVLPNRNTLGLVAVLLAMWYAGASQNNGAAYLLCFLLAGVALVSMLHAWSNLRGVLLEAEGIRPVFAGEVLTIPLRASSTRRREHFGLWIFARDIEDAARFQNVPATGKAESLLRLRPEQRGVFHDLKVRVESRFPLGFFTASRSLRLIQPHYVYPAAEGARPLPVTLQATRQSRDGLRTEGDDFGGVRAWRVGESQRHIDWKAAARGQPLLVKQWAGDADRTVSLEWELLAGVETEARLSQLARWVVLAERTGANYGLRIPGTTLPPSRGDAHHHACLRALAAFDAEAAASPLPLSDAPAS